MMSTIDRSKLLIYVLLIRDGRVYITAFFPDNFLWFAPSVYTNVVQQFMAHKADYGQVQ